MAPLQASPYAVVLASMLSKALGFLWYTNLLYRAKLRYMYGHSEGTPVVRPASTAKAVVAYVALACATSWAFLVAFTAFRAEVTVIAARPATLPDELGFVALAWAGFFLPGATNKLVRQFKPWQVAVIDGGHERLRGGMLWGIARAFA
jgi:hypothetical protein